MRATGGGTGGAARSVACAAMLAVAAALGLAGCASTPLPPWPPKSPSTTAAPEPVSAPGQRPLPQVAASTPRPRVVIDVPAGGPPLPSPPPSLAAIAAHFPEPAVEFATPAFQRGRSAFTDSDELRAMLYAIERGSVVAERGVDVKVIALGTSQSGLPIEALAFTRLPLPPASPAPTAAMSRRPAVVVVAGQHGDEPAGSEALLVVAQALAAGRLDGVLAQVDVVLLPRANPDGAALFQRGAADGSDVNRDHLLLRTPEAQAQARLLVDFAPIVVLDLHEYPVGGAFTQKFGAVQRFDALLQYATVANLPPFITRAAEEWFRVPLVAALRGAGLSADWYASTSADPADRKLAMGGVGPQIGRNAAGLRNAVSLLVETRGGGLGRAELKRRVQANVVAVTSVLGNAAVHAGDLVKLRQFVERETAANACQGEAIVEAGPTPSEYALSVIDAGSGAIRRIDVAWDSALQLRALKSRPRPCGYWLAASEVDAVRRLRLLGIEVGKFEEPTELRAEGYREIARTPVAGSPGAVAGAATRVAVQTVPALLDIAAGGYYVSLEQRLANLAIAALEPEAPASFAANRVVTAVTGQARILQRPQARLTTVP